MHAQWLAASSRWKRERGQKEKKRTKLQNRRPAPNVLLPETLAVLRIIVADETLMLSRVFGATGRKIVFV
jgi:hypothetical protein